MNTDRFKRFAEFISVVYPVGDYPRVMSVADARGSLAKELEALGYYVTIVDPKVPAYLGHIKEEFRAEMAQDMDLVVGLKPDQATQEIVRAVRQCPVAVVPCCNYWPGHHGDVREAVRQEFSRLGAFVSEEVLDFPGRNIVITGEML